MGARSTESEVDDEAAPHSSFGLGVNGEGDGEGEEEEEEEDIQDSWSMDRTMLADLPLLWDIVGTICRSTSTATSLAKTKEEGEPILLTWREECEESVKSLVHVLFVINVLASRRSGLPELDDILRETTLVQTDVDAPISHSNAMDLCAPVVQQIGSMTLFSAAPSSSSGKSVGQSVWPTLCGCQESVGEGSAECSPVFTAVMHPLYRRFLSAIKMPPRRCGAVINEESRGAADLKSKDLLVILKVSF
jgi:hypothetical protein